MPKLAKPDDAPRGAPPGHTGALAAAAWLGERCLDAEHSRWFVEIELLAPASGARLQLDIYAEEWGFQFHHKGASSWIRVTDVPFVHGRDDHALLARTPELGKMRVFVAALEREYDVRFDRRTPRIRTRLSRAEPTLRAWIASL